MKLQRNILLNDRGIALVMVLILAVISLAIMAALLYMITASTEVSGIEKRYKTALEAGKGGANVIFQAIAAGGDPGYITKAIDQGGLGGSIPAASVSATINGAATNCLNAKLNNATSAWQSACDNSVSINPAQSSTYDWTFQLGTIPTYTVYAKIVDTVNGNSSRSVDAATTLIKSGVVSASEGEVPVKSYPYLYTIEVQTVNSANTAEKVDYSVLYEY